MSRDDRFRSRRQIAKFRRNGNFLGRARFFHSLFQQAELFLSMSALLDFAASFAATHVFNPYFVRISDLLDLMECSSRPR